MTLTEKQRTTVSSTYYILEGNVADVEARVSELKRVYHPWGYGTAVQHREDHADGTAYVVVARANSCD